MTSLRRAGYPPDGPAIRSSQTRPFASTVEIQLSILDVGTTSGRSLGNKMLRKLSRFEGLCVLRTSPDIFTS